MTEKEPSQQPESEGPAEPAAPPPAAPPALEIDTSPFPEPTIEKIDAGLPGGVDLEL